ncbi:MAG: cyclase family protein [Gemmatimonadales bacterium]
MTRKRIDVSHTVEHGMVTYKGLPAPLICDYLSRERSRGRYAAGTEFQIGQISMVANTGTYVDSPFHRFADGQDLSELPLESLADLECLVVRAGREEGEKKRRGGEEEKRRGGERDAARAIGSLPFADEEVRGKAVLFHTGWDRHWRTDRYFEGHPYLTAGLAERLAAAGARIVGIDSHNIDDTTSNTRPVHTTLLGAGIPIVEHLTNLVALPDREARFFAVPVKVKGFGTFPVRAFALA